MTNLAWVKNISGKMTPGRVLRCGGGAWMLSTPMIAYSAAKADRGEMLAEASSQAVGLATYPALSGLASAVTAGMGPLPKAAAMIASIALAATPAAHLERSVFRAVRSFTQMEHRIRSLETGGDYRDSATAEALRMRAVSEMTGGLQTARTYLGREAALMHR